MAATSLKFKIKKHVTVELFKVPDNGTPIYVHFTSEIFKAMRNEGEEKRYEEALAVFNKVMSEGTPEQKREAKAPTPPNPPLLAHGINLETGQVIQIIVGKVLEGELLSAFPNHEYVGHAFEIKKLKPSGSKRYAMYQVAEIELDEEAAKVVAAAAPTTRSGHAVAPAGGVVPNAAPTSGSPASGTPAGGQGTPAGGMVPGVKSPATV